MIVVLHLLGIDVIAWFRELWDQIKAVPVGYIVAGLFFQTLQTVFAGLSYYGILSAAYPGQVKLAPIVTAYAVGVAMNNFLPANIGTFVTLLMFVALIPRCTFAGALAAYLVQKIFFTIAGTFVYLYLFLSVPGSFDLSLGNVHEHPVVAVSIAVGAVLLCVIVGRIFWRQVKKLWEQAKQGGAILRTPKRYFTRAFLPSFISWTLQADRDRDLPGGVRDPGHVRVDHVGDRLGLARQRRLGHARRRRDHAGDERARPRRLLQRAERRRGRLLHGPAADHDRVERALRARPRRLRLRLDGRQGARHASPTRARRTRSPSRRPPAPRRRKRSARPGRTRRTG